MFDNFFGKIGKGGSYITDSRVARFQAPKTVLKAPGQDLRSELTIDSTDHRFYTVPVFSVQGNELWLLFLTYFGPLRAF